MTHQYTIEKILQLTKNLLKEVDKKLESSNHDVNTALQKVGNALSNLEQNKLRALIDYKDNIDHLIQDDEPRTLISLEDYGKLDKS
ncbi:hypothetical protein [Nostoc sp.]|uniref:hypothetical protein n=1 Tax=Nostoc sp. TaxID=1180 RepID=UPI002FFB272D